MRVFHRFKATNTIIHIQLVVNMHPCPRFRWLARVRVLPTTKVRLRRMELKNSNSSNNLGVLPPVLLARCLKARPRPPLEQSRAWVIHSSSNISSNCNIHMHIQQMCLQMACTAEAFLPLAQGQDQVQGQGVMVLLLFRHTPKEPFHLTGKIVVVELSRSIFFASWLSAAQGQDKA
jgi:hypothetical protein